MNLLYYTAALLALGAAYYKTRHLLHDLTSPTLWGFCSTLYALGTAFALLDNASRPVIDRLVGVEDFARWLGNSCTLIAACSIQIVLNYFTHRPGSPPPRLRLRVGLLPAAIIAMGVLIFSQRLAAPDVSDFIDRYGDRPAIAGYLLIYLIYLGVAMADAVQLSLRYAPRAPQKYLRVGLRLVATGSGTGLAYVVYKSVFTLLRVTHAPVVGTEGIVGPVLGLLATIQIVIGSTIGTWGPDAEERYARWRSYRRLRPLWRELRTAFPEVVLDRTLHDADERLYRCIIEIRDGQRLLRPYHDPAVAAAVADAARAAGLDERETAIHVEAAMLAASLQARQSGQPPQEASPTGAAPAVPLDLDAETASLEKVAVAFARSPLVRQALTAAASANVPEGKVALDDRH